MSPIETLDAGALEAWANSSADALNASLPTATRDELLAALRKDADSPKASFRALATLALLDDCLAVAHLAIEADGVVDPVEITRARPLATAAARRYFTQLARYEAFGELESHADAAAFLRYHALDDQPFGNRHAARWRGLALCQRAAAHAQNPELVRTHERTLARVMEAVFAGRASASENAARKRLRALFEAGGQPGVDPRVVAFCRADGPEVFSSVAHGAQIFERDPLDVETIHGEARAVFQTQLEHAITPARHGVGHGRTLLVLGTAGSGKTHLLRALRASVHQQRLGYVGYLQMTSDVGDYGRYVLAKLIDSLERPYDAPELADSSLLYLSSGLAEHDGALSPADLAMLREGELATEALPAFVGRLVDQLVRTETLAGVDTDLVQALLLLQRRDAATQRRVSKFLRCEPLTSYEQGLLGGLAGRTAPEDPDRTIRELGRLMFDLQMQALVLLVDQIEDTITDDRGHQRVQKAVDVLRRITDAIPSAVVVIACLEDVYDAIKPRLTQSVVDRLERDPAPTRLTARRSRAEIEEMLVARLDFLYDSLGATWRADDPIFPFRAEQLDERTNQRARDCLAFFRRFQEQCIRAGAIAQPAAAPLAPPPATPPPDLDDLSRAWNDARIQPATAPDDDLGLLTLVARGVAACAVELDAPLETALEQRAGRPRLTISSPSRAMTPRVLEVCNRQAQGGHLGKQLDSLRGGAQRDTVPVALRTSDFNFNPKSVTARQVGELIAAGGLALVADEGDLRAILAFETFAARHEARAEFAAWRRQARPLASLPLLRRLTEGLRAAAAAAPVPAAPPPPAPPKPAPAPAPSPAPAPHLLRVGVTPTIRAEAVTIPLDELKKHAVFLGSTGSGKTTLACNVIEQLLERGISVLVIDRKGDLAKYASPAWWDEVPGDPVTAARKRALRARVDVALYTPGDVTGRPLRIPVVPAGMSEMSTQERDQVAHAAANGLAAMLGYGRGEAQRKRIAILKKAIELNATAGGATLEHLKDTISQPDPELLAAVGNLTRHFSNLAEDLDTLAIEKGMLLSGAGEPLDVAAMLSAPPGRARLTIISAVALGDVAALQFWVSRLLVELGRVVRKQPSPELRAVAFFDEADSYVPAMSTPPTKEPMFDLLRRARSGGLGILLGSQNPGDFDYRARDNIATWFVGKVAQDRAIEKMRNLIATYPNVAARLAGQAVGCFFLLGGPQARELRADPSMMRTEQLAEREVLSLAAQGRPA